MKLRQRLRALDLLVGRHLARGNLAFEHPRGVGVAPLLQVNVPEHLVDLVLVEGRLAGGGIGFLDLAQRLVPALLGDRVLRRLERHADLLADLLLGFGGGRDHQHRARDTQPAGHGQHAAENETRLPHRIPHWGS
jgi:hypothetical protein